MGLHNEEPVPEGGSGSGRGIEEGPSWCRRARQGWGQPSMMNAQSAAVWTGISVNISSQVSWELSFWRTDPKEGGFAGSVSRRP